MQPYGIVTRSRFQSFGIFFLAPGRLGLRKASSRQVGERYNDKDIASGYERRPSSIRPKKGTMTADLSALQPSPFRVHPTAEIHPHSVVGDGSVIWHYCQIRERAIIGRNCVLGKNVYVDVDVRMGQNCKIQNNVCLFRGTELEDGVFVGPHSVLLNDKLPRAIKPDGTLKGPGDWTVSGVTVRYGASVGGRSVLLPGIVIGRWAMIGAGAVVTRDVPDFALVYGNPARLCGYVDAAGNKRTEPPAPRRGGY